MTRIRPTGQEGAIETIDVLGSGPDRQGIFTKELVETDDAELQQIVEKAVHDLGAPIALVSVVLDHIQFFKAHHGLPADSEASRRTRRGVSFCQFVVRDGKAFEVTDALSDPRVPQHLVEESGIRSYLGIPIRLGDTIVGSLCVIDTKARAFSREDRENLTELASLVNERLTALTEVRRQARLRMAEKASTPALAELRESLAAMRHAASTRLPAVSVIRAALKLSSQVLDGKAVSPRVRNRTLKAALEALEATEDAFCDITAFAADCNDCVLALEHLTTFAPSTRLSDVLTAAQDLARQCTRAVGGAPLPDLPHDPVLHTQKPLAIAVVTILLMTVAARLAELGRSEGIQMQIGKRGSAELEVSAPELQEAVVAQIAADLSEQIGIDPTIAIGCSPTAVRLTFSVANDEDAA